MLKIQVVGPGCSNCDNLAKICQEVVIEEELEAYVEKITDPAKFAELGVMLTPALIVNGQMLSMGKIPPKQTLAKWLAEANRNA